MARKSQSFVACSSTSLKDLRAAKRTYSQRLLGKPARTAKGKAVAEIAPLTPQHNVVGVGIGEKMVGGKPTGVVCVKFLVRAKYAESRLSRKHRLPKTVDGLPVDVEAVGTFRRLATVATKKATTSLPQPTANFAVLPNPRIKIRPIQPGCSVGFKHPNPLRRVAGTFGALVRAAGGVYILSNNHILANENQLPLGASIFQQGLKDGGNANTDAVAVLSQFVRLRPGGEPNKVDCAIARISASVNATNSILHIGPPRSQGTAQQSMEVHKFGRSSEYTVGRVTSAEMDVSVVYETGMFNFQKQIIIKGQDGQLFAREGDSGALVLERTTQMVIGLLLGVGINDDGEAHAIACPIDEVLKALQATLVFG